MHSRKGKSQTQEVVHILWFCFKCHSGNDETIETENMSLASKNWDGQEKRVCYKGMGEIWGGGVFFGSSRLHFTVLWVFAKIHKAGYKRGQILL